MPKTISALFVLSVVLVLSVRAGAAEPPSVYELPAAPTERDGVNLGGVNFAAEARYMSNHIYRGINITELLGDVTKHDSHGGSNFQFEGKLSFNLDKLPHPFIGVFTNVLDSDPVSNFEEVRPMFGADWAIRPFVFSFGDNIYIYPNRSEAGTGDLWVKVLLDDAAVLHREKALLTPYILIAYDYDAYDGWYVEAGISHEFEIEGTGLTLTPLARAAFVASHQEFALTPGGDDTGFQHYDIGVMAKYNLNTLLNVSQRYGNWSLTGYLYYTDGLDSDLRSATKLWGGGGIQITY